MIVSASYCKILSQLWCAHFMNNLLEKNMAAYNSVAAQEASALIAKNAILVDVREPAEFNAHHIPNAKLHPLGAIDANQLAEYGDKTVLIYCQKGMRGQKACEKILRDNPHSKVVNLVGGIEAWQAAGFAVKKGTSSVLPLDRQVQITLGGLILTFSLLGYYININLMFVSAFLGAGLLLSGLTGFCGLARVLSKAPWNQ
jgi:rhodanese-related sulfurtransferase